MPVFYPSQNFSPSSFSNATLILPAVSLGNVPQLTCDLLISSLGLQRVGFTGRGDTVAPFVGQGEHSELVTGGLEVYGQEGSELFVVQQRSPTLKDKKDEHVALVESFIDSYSFGFLLLLTSLDSAHQNDTQLLTPYQRITPPSQSVSASPYLQRLQRIPPLSLAIDSSSHTLPSKDSHYPPFLPAAGLTRRLLSSWSRDEKSIPHGALSVWCVEGDNRGDAKGLTNVVLDILGIANDVELREPTSWKGLFGTTRGWSGGMGADSELYG
ncbi:uncharacterized protein L203_106214 [Cryptococcus depauperatus CBS 7841]|uniref:Proteasome assembly chaperone 2 n=1 Tax=Cryptococcus depauperatus CBS 7841 TaxID=1295531 RepID=A0AAJ8JZ44_9TREE